MKYAFLRVLAAVLCLVCAAVPLHAQGTALQKELLVLARPTTGIVGLSPEGELFRSTDSGANWTSVRVADSQRALYTVAVSGSTVVAMGDAGNFVRSTDNGVTWSQLASSVPSFGSGAIHAIAAHGTTWVAVGERGGDFVALRSTDNGASWSVATSLPSPILGGSLYGVAWSGATGERWVAVGGDGISGYTTTSTDGNTWTTLAGTNTSLYAVSSNGSGTLIAVGDIGAILRSTDSGSSFTAIDGGLVSEALRSVAFLSGSNWVIGGDNAVLISVSGSTPSLVSGPSTDTTKPVTALLSDGTASGYYYYSEIAASEPHGPISLQIAIVTGQLKLTLVGAQAGNSYELETSTTLTSWSTVASSSQTYTGGAAPVWNMALPVGGRVFYRARVVTP
jgi:photosystem II stability/assembly factor-like uncharacterized protein